MRVQTFGLRACDGALVPNAIQDPLAIIGGCGHVGLPLGLAFAQKGFRVDLIDASPQRVSQVNQGRMPFHEEDADALLLQLVRSGRLKAVDDDTSLADAATIIVTIGTPVDEYLDPSVGAFDRAFGTLLSRVRPNQLLILRSTVFPGMTDRLARRLEEIGRGDVDLAYCPERIVQGQSVSELQHLPQLIRGVTPPAAQRAGDLFHILCQKIIYLKPIEAELAKLFCNAGRYINFAMSNQFYVMAEHFGAEFHRLYQA